MDQRGRTEISAKQKLFQNPFTLLKLLRMPKLFMLNLLLLTILAIVPETFFKNISLLKRIRNLLHVNINHVFMKNNYFQTKNLVRGVALQISLIFG